MKIEDTSPLITRLDGGPPLPQGTRERSREREETSAPPGDTVRLGSEGSTAGSPVVSRGHSLTPGTGAIAPAAAGALSAGTAGEVAGTLLGGALGAVIGGAGRSLLRGFLYELRKSPEGSALSRKIAGLGSPSAESPQPRVPTPADLFAGLETRIHKALEPGQAEEYLIHEALGRTRSYFALKEEPLVVPVPSSLLGPQSAPGSGLARGFSPEVEALRVQSLRWTDVDSYVETRLGPLTGVLDTLTEKDEVRFTNVPFRQSLEGAGNARSAERYNLPESSWSKEIHLVERSDGSRLLVISAMPGKVLLRHEELLVKRYLENKGLRPSIAVLESDSVYDRNYGALRDFFREKSGEMGGVDTVAVGYDAAFRKSWSGYLQASVGSDASPWSADIYQLPGDHRVAVLASRDSFHGEILGQNLKKLVEDNPGIRNVFAAGSAGSLHVRETYGLVFPHRLSGSSGCSIRNVLSGGSEDLTHVSVISPLQETPDFLREAMAAGATTVDMEMGAVADALAGTGVNFGAGLLVTDFPVERPLSRGTSLALADSEKKYGQVGRYAEALFDFLTRGAPVYDHRLERDMGKPFSEMSREKIAWDVEALGQMTHREKALFDRICALCPSYSFRMTEKRLQRVLEDGAILSTAQVAQLKNAPVSPFTPEVEEKLYGAYDYTFGVVGFGNDERQYGEAEIIVKPEVWKARSWATIRSGWRCAISTAREREGASKDAPFNEPDSETLEAVRKRFAQWVVIPKDYMTSLAAWTIRQLRACDPPRLQEFAEASDEELERLLHRFDYASLEGKIKGAMNLEDIQKVVLPEGCDGGLVKMLSDRGIPFSFRPPRAASGKGRRPLSSP